MSSLFPRILSKGNYTYSDFKMLTSGYVSGDIQENDMEDWIKHVFKRGMSIEESALYTKSIIKSGQKIDKIPIQTFDENLVQKIDKIRFKILTNIWFKNSTKT